MRAHLIGGHANGQEFAIDSPPNPSIRTPELDPDPPLGQRYCIEKDIISPIPTWIEHEYKLLWHDSRDAIYKWVAPRLMASWEFIIQPPAYYGPLLDKLHDLTGVEQAGKALKVMSVQYGPTEIRVGGLVMVDGPADAQATKDASDAVQSLIDAHLRKYKITACTVDVQNG